MPNKNNRGLRIVIFFFVIAAMAFGFEYAFAGITEEEFLSDKMNVKITMDLEDTSLRAVLKMLSVQSGLNFIASEAVADRKITLYMDNVMLKDALDKIFNINNLTYELDTDSNILIVKDWGKPSIELETRVYFQKYATVTNTKEKVGSSGLKEALSKVISEYGKMTEDPSTNSIIITDMPSKFPLIEQIITKLDIPTPQVMVEVEILDVDKQDVDKLGFNWATTTSWFKYLTSSTGSLNKFSQNPFPPLRSLGGENAYSRTWGFVFEFLSTRKTTKFLARPKLFMLNNETAEIKISASEAIGVVNSYDDQGRLTSQAAERATTGVILKVSPQISMSTGEITMNLQPSISETTESSIDLVTSSGVSQKLKNPEERSLKSTVRIKDGETIVVGGLIRQSTATSVTKIPFFADIPLIGLLFRNKQVDPRKDREILVFITPKIIKSNSEAVASGKLTPPKVFTEREQDNLVNNAVRSEIVSRTLGVYETKNK